MSAFTFSAHSIGELLEVNFRPQWLTGTEINVGAPLSVVREKDEESV